MQLASLADETVIPISVSGKRVKSSGNAIPFNVIDKSVGDNYCTHLMFAVWIVLLLGLKLHQCRV